MIKSITDLIKRIQNDLSKWDNVSKPWFRGESGDQFLCPKIAEHSANEENYLLQSFRRQAGGLANVPPRGHTDLWLFIAQHYGVPTRLLDWTEGALHALYFAINRGNSNPRLYMLNPRNLNDLAGLVTRPPNYPLSWVKVGKFYVALAWQNRSLGEAQVAILEENGFDLNIPIAFPATYQDQRMISQRSCFTIHGKSLKPLNEILEEKDVDLSDYVIEYEIDMDARHSLLKELS